MCKNLAIVSVTVSFLLSLAATINSFFPEKVRFNTPADEPFIQQIVDKTLLEQARYETDRRYINTVPEIRERVINWHFSKDGQTGFGKLSVKILLSIAGLFFAFFLLCSAYGVYSSLGLKSYFKIKEDYWKEKTRSERKALDDLLALQDKIANIK